MAIQATAVQVKRKELAEDERLFGRPKTSRPSLFAAPHAT